MNCLQEQKSKASRKLTNPVTFHRSLGTISSSENQLQSIFSLGTQKREVPQIIGIIQNLALISASLF